MNNEKMSQQDLTESILALSTEEMENLLYELQSTKFWVAILKYNGDRMEMAKNALMSINASKEPEKISQTQGILAGLSDLYAAVSAISKRKDKVGQSEVEEVKAE